MDPAVGEHVIFTGHPPWRGVLSFYLKAAGGALVLALRRRRGRPLTWVSCGATRARAS